LVIWDAILNGIVSVIDTSMISKVEDKIAALSKMKDITDNPTTSRFFDSESITIKNLEEEQKENSKINERGKIFCSWETYSTEDLIKILINKDFKYPMDFYSGGIHIIERIYRFRWPDITPTLKTELEKFINSSSHDSKENHVKCVTECYLYGINEDKEKLVIFRDTKLKNGNFEMLFHFWEVAGDVCLSEPSIYLELMEYVEKSIMFRPRYEAMIALGKFGSVFGENAAKIIKSKILDSSPFITKVFTYYL